MASSNSPTATNRAGRTVAVFRAGFDVLRIPAHTMDLKTSVKGRQSAEPRSFCGTVGRIRVGLSLTKVQALQGHASSPLWSSGLGSTKLLKKATLPATVTN